jgi:hypothetical protein
MDGKERRNHKRINPCVIFLHPSKSNVKADGTDARRHMVAIAATSGTGAPEPRRLQGSWR